MLRDVILAAILSLLLVADADDSWRARGPRTSHHDHESHSAHSWRNPGEEDSDSDSSNSASKSREGCPQLPPPDRSGTSGVGSGGSRSEISDGGWLSGSASFSGNGLLAGQSNDFGDGSQHRPSLSKKGVILVAAGGVLLGAGLTVFAIALVLHKRSVARVRAAEAQRHNAVAPISVVTGKGKGDLPVLPDVVVVESVEVLAKDPDGVCLGVVCDPPAKLV